MADRALFLHIGHHKTGTTTLQERIFPNLSSVTYLPKKSDITAGLRKAFKNGNPRRTWQQSGREIFAQLVKELDQRGMDGSALISCEGMSAPKIFASSSVLSSKVRRDPSLLAAHVRECRMAATRAGFAAVRVIMGIRRQDQYLASRYAQHGVLAEEPGQADFERQSLEIIDPAKRYFVDGIWLDFQMTRDLIVDVLGVNGVLILPLEQLNSDRMGYFKALGGFLDEAIGLDDATGHRLNMRGVAPDIWRCHAQEVPRKFDSEKPSDFEIYLSQEVKSRILATYKDSNARLASDIGIDLTRYGYC
jgi:hypothetical protein